MIESFEQDFSVLSDRIRKSGGSGIHISRLHKKDGDSSLCWEFEKDGYLSFLGDVGFAHTPKDAWNKAISTFCIWIYCERALQGSLKFEFLKKDRTCCTFDFHLGFTGWRTCWVPFSDMEGTPEEEMDQIRISAKTMTGGRVWMDQLISSSMIDSRHHTRDYQVPFVNRNGDMAVNNHWLSLCRFWDLQVSHLESMKGDPGDFPDVSLVEERFQSYLYDRYGFGEADGEDEKSVMETLRQEFASYELEEMEGRIKGRAVESHVHRDAYLADRKEEMIRLTHAIDMKECAAFLLKTACYYQKAKEQEKTWLEQSFVLLMRHILDQGWACKSSLGTAHHLGYPMFSLYHAVYLMRQVLVREHLFLEVRDMVGWFSGAGRMFRPETELDNESMDTLNTLLQGITVWIFFQDQEQVKHRCLQALSHWLSSCMKPSPGVSGPFKADGSAFHHCSHYPAYAVGGFDGVTPIVYCLSATPYRIGAEGHQTLKNAVLAMRLYCNRYHWLVSMSARHPAGEGPMAGITSLVPFYYLALAGTPFGDKDYDQEMGNAYLRLAEHLPEKEIFVKRIREEGSKAEPDPQGTVAMNYSCALIHRKDDWMAGVRGHSRYIWAHESYESNNLYGRYITYGNLQILSGGSPVNNRDSGFSQPGWDWASWPGTTAVHLPLEKLRSVVCNVDSFSGFEEMLLSDETFAGGVTMDGDCGIFGMKLHSHEKYDGSERARKSWFFFGNRIVCLGSAIENSNGRYETRTTLFQNVITDKGKSCRLGNMEITLGESVRMDLEKSAWIIDNVGNGYYIPDGQTLFVALEHQKSRNQNTDTDSEGDFAKAWLDHGRSPVDHSYEYAVLIRSDQEEMKRFSGDMQCPVPPYSVLECSKNAHILYDRERETYSYVFFEKGNGCRYGKIWGTDTPILAMEQNKNGVLKLSLCDPDLRFYTGQETEKGEVSLYSRDWINNPSMPQKVKVWLRGEYSQKSGQSPASLTCQDGFTILEFSACDGNTVTFELIEK